MRILLFTLGFLVLPAFAQDLQEGDAAPLPVVEDSYGHPVDLAELSASGTWLVLWFYPRAFTAGCSLQAKRYSDLAGELERVNALAFGVSNDSAETQCAFVEELAQNGQMIPDEARVLADAYGVGGPSFSRDTVLIAPDGTLERIWRRVDPLDDADRVLEYLKRRASR